MDKTMKIWTLAFCLTLCASAAAQDGDQFIRYRANDPFVFCTQGQKRPDKCWWPIAPYTGAYVVDPTCDPPNIDGRPWTPADYDSRSQYLQICPQAIHSGGWEGTAPPESTPMEH